MTKMLEDVLARYGVKELNWKPKGELEHANVDTSTTAVIVALPYAMDPIRLVGDEDKHATLMFFGETQSLESGAKDEIINTLEQVSKMVSPFGESILNVERLGSDVPPALVAKLTNRQLETIRNIISVNPKFEGYLANTQQYPSFTPHVTLGYPDYTGEAEIRAKAQQLRRVRFDRLALWWGNEKFEFPLNAYGEDTSEAGWSEDLVADFLAHHGVKGMKWGVHLFGKGGSGGAFKPGDKRAAPAVSEDYRTASAARAKPLHQLSNDDLKNLLTRMELEQRYSRLTAEAPPPATASRMDKGKRYVGKLIADIGQEQVGRVAKAAVAIQVEKKLSGGKSLGKSTFKEALAERIKPKKK